MSLSALPVKISGDKIALADYVIIRANFASLIAGLPAWNEVTDTWSWLASDSPTFTITVPTDATLIYGPGTRIRLKQGGAYKYFIVTAVSATVLTVYGGTDYTLAAATITDVAFSLMKTPLGFPLDPTKWTVSLSDTSDRTQATSTSGTWYNPGSLTMSVPIGIWNVRWEAALSSTTGSKALQGTLSTANNSESDADLTAAQGEGTAAMPTTVGREKTLVLAAKTSYFLNIRNTSGGTPDITIAGSTGAKTIARAVCAYL